jgi:hypothetical protein
MLDASRNWPGHCMPLYETSKYRAELIQILLGTICEQQDRAS